MMKDNLWTTSDRSSVYFVPQYFEAVFEHEHPSAFKIDEHFAFGSLLDRRPFGFGGEAYLKSLRENNIKIITYHP